MGNAEVRPARTPGAGTAEEPHDGQAFHGGDHPRVYREALGPALFKQSAHMAHVRYEAVHENHTENGDLRGHGRADVRWVFSEEPGAEEHLLRSGLELVMDTRLEPGAAMGLHHHGRTEEVYYLLEGELTITLRTQEGEKVVRTLRPGDAHAILVGQAHSSLAGPQGARLLVVAVRVR